MQPKTAWVSVAMCSSMRLSWQFRMTLARSLHVPPVGSVFDAKASKVVRILRLLACRLLMADLVTPKDAGRRFHEIRSRRSCGACGAGNLWFHHVGSRRSCGACGAVVNWGGEGGRDCRASTWSWAFPTFVFAWFAFLCRLGGFSFVLLVTSRRDKLIRMHFGRDPGLFPTLLVGTS